MIEAENSIDILEWLEKNRLKLIVEYADSKETVKSMFMKYKKIRPDLNARQMRRVLEKTKKTTPRHFVVDEAYEMATSKDGIESSYLKELMEKHYGVDVVITGNGKNAIAKKFQKYTQKDYWEVTNNLRSKAQREGKTITIVPTYLYKKPIKFLSNAAKELEKVIKQIEKVKAESIKRLGLKDIADIESYSAAIALCTTNSLTNKGAKAHLSKQHKLIETLIKSKEQ